MSESPSSPSKSISLDDLIALNDEIASLVRAGVPLETGLRGFAATAPGKLAKISARLAKRISDG